jgi:hypothetical protein
MGLRLLENMVLGTFGPKTDECRGGWGKLHYEALDNVCSLSNIKIMESRKMS